MQNIVKKTESNLFTRLFMRKQSTSQAMFITQHRSDIAPLMINQSSENTPRVTASSQTNFNALVNINITPVTVAKNPNYIPKRIRLRPTPIRIPMVRVHDARLQEIELLCKQPSPEQNQAPRVVRTLPRTQTNTRRQGIIM